MLIPEFSKTNKESIKFLSILKERFLNHNPIAMVWKPLEYDNWGSYQKYVTCLYSELEEIYIKDEDLNKFMLDCNRLIETYHPVLNVSAISFYIDFLLYIKKPDLAIKEWKKFTYQDGQGTDQSILQIIEFEQATKKSIVDATMIRIMASGQTQLTDFGRRNFDELSDLINKYIEDNFKVSFFEVFYKNYSFNWKWKKTYLFDYYSKFFQVNKKTINFWNAYADNKSGWATKNDGSISINLTYQAIRFECARILREIENEYRLLIGSNKIGEAWISETELYYKIKSHFDDIEVIQHGRPDWMGRQHFDVWIPPFKIALEYQGEQHDKPVDFFGGKEAFEKNKKRDLVKKQKAKKNGIYLIEVRNGYDIKEIITEINENKCNKIS